MCELKIYEDKVINLLYRPETYKTILKDNYGKNSITTSTRRKINKLMQYGILCGKNIKYSSSDYGKEVIFYMMEKEYFIVFTKKDVYYCSNINSSENKTKLIDSFILKDENWYPMYNIEINTSEVILCF